MVKLKIIIIHDSFLDIQIHKIVFDFFCQQNLEI
jgi:hypothetical protein